MKCPHCNKEIGSDLPHRRANNMDSEPFCVRIALFIMGALFAMLLPILLALTIGIWGAFLSDLTHGYEQMPAKTTGEHENQYN